MPDDASVIASFRHNGRELWTQRVAHVPREGQWCRFASYGFMAVDPDNDLGLWVVQKIEWQFSHQEGVGERADVTVHLRRFHPGERGNDHEPTGYDYEEAPDA